MNRTILLVGPTACGKSEAAIALAKKLNGEIVNMDSRQIYKFLRAGTAQPDAQQKKLVPHHLYDFLDPQQPYNAGQYLQDALCAVGDIQARKKIPILVGGTGLYAQAITNGLAPLPQANPAIREKLMLRAKQEGRKKLHEELKKIDPQAAAKIPWQNIHRLVRALEVFELSGTPISELQKIPGAKKISGEVLWFGLQWEKTNLHERIQKRCQAIAPLILEETQALLAQNYPPTCPAFASVGYPQALQCLQKQINEAQYLDALISATKQYAKRQNTWFKRNPRIRWLQIKNPFDALTIAREIINKW